ncbi:GDP-mannose mannosyl hydrolase [Thalassotalea litorea]|uniref:GDP-mannose mannosyl hydrolase n=1 Tax=Thalassotalea litorea TaxID=2020715 RepID=A0A5R9IKS9_9GAMM|nr:GDP-mannose mannosyl hydrolase [Thalassotalea litorea]TLU65073.1 GDP-mannose mannosyl hydrolase [Thalassotalea litorea]
MFLDSKTFNTVIASTPLVSIDLIVRNQSGEALLGYRNNRPAQGYWFVPGGRIVKDESIDSAFERLVEAELGVKVEKNQGDESSRAQGGGYQGFESARFIGVYQHFYDDCVFDTNSSLNEKSQETTSTHYVVLAYEITLEIKLADLPNQQHSKYQFLSVDELLSTRDVHQHSKWYFDPKQENNFTISDKK